MDTYLGLLEHESRALDRVRSARKLDLPECVVPLSRLLEARLVKQAAREYIEVLRLLEIFLLAEVAVEQAFILTPSVSTLCGTGALPHRTSAAAVGHGQLASPAASPGAHHPRRRLDEPTLHAGSCSELAGEPHEHGKYRHCAGSA